MLPILLAIALMQSADLVPPTQRGSDLYQSCKTGVKVMDSQTATTHDISEGMVCSAYLMGFLDASGMFPNNSICADEATLGTVSRVYVAYMEANPKVMDQPKAVGVYEALAIAYPCPVKATPPKRSSKK